jgi:hypothetical protein
MPSDPVFVLCTSRSGSTLLRFLLDAHPELACPPEIRFPFVCTQLATMWSTLEAAYTPAAADGQQPLPAPVVAGIRLTMGLVIGPYLVRRGKRRYCDKNLGTEQHVDRLLQIFPGAQFICLYRHPMDMIASGIEACPWGMHNYGFEPYVAGSPGNTVLALARYWSEHTAAILAAEEKLGERCHRIRYEDLVSDPDRVADGIFGFLGVPPADGISQRCFSLDRERFAPGDYKIWTTSEITADSVGRGWSVPADLIPAPVTGTLNELAAKLGYVPIDAAWGTTNRPGDLRLTESGQPSPPGAGRDGPVLLPAGARLAGERLESGLLRLDDGFARKWHPLSQESFLVIAMAPTGQGEDSWWRVDLPARSITAGTGRCPDNADWRVAGPASAWEQIIHAGTNVGVAFRRNGMRYTDNGEGGAGTPLADIRVAMMSELIGVSTWHPVGADSAPGRHTPAGQPDDCHEPAGRLPQTA